MRLLLENVRCPAGKLPLCFDASIEGACIGLFGPSGSGKTTLVELLAGLRRPSTGRIQFNDTVLVDVSAGVFIPPERRHVGYVPQDGALFPHLSVEANLRYGEARRAATEPSLYEVCALLGIGALLHRSVTTLSGGERQRVAIGRALLAGPGLLLLDEPLASLDPSRKETILPYLREIRDRLKLPMLYVSHAPTEVQALCDQLAVVLEGRIAQSGPTAEVFNRPASAEIARIVGVETVHRVQVLGGEGVLVAVSVNGVRLLGRGDSLSEGDTEALLSIRAEDVMLLRSEQTPTASARNRLRTTVLSIHRAGPFCRVELDCGFPLVALLSPQAVEELSIAPGEKLWALVKISGVHLLPV